MTYATVVGGLAGISVGYYRLSHTSLMRNAVLFESSARMMLASGLIMLGAVLILHLIKRFAPRQPGRPLIPDASWRRALGAIEGACSLMCVYYAFNYKIDPGTRFDVPWAMLFAWGLGTGLGVGGLRLGDPIGQLLGGISVVVLGAALVILLVNGVTI